MKRILVSLAVSAALLAGVPALAAFSPHSPVITDADAAQTVNIKAGEDFFIALASNRTTGFGWTAKVGDDRILAYEGNVYQNPSSGLMGAGGQQLFVFHANRTGSTTIVFNYARSFEPNVPAAKTLSFTISVQ
jgi:predicted secreted protein